MLFEAGSLSVPLVAFGVGALHALDADHIMAVSSLAVRRIEAARCVRLGVRWAIGHGAILLALGGLCYALGQALPATWHIYAERLVALVLCAVGATVLVGLITGGARLHLHRHPGIAAHVHWVRDDDAHEQDESGDNHGAVLIGALHGLAGSAPMLALIPTGQHGDLAGGILVLTAFSIGVLLTMLLFGFALGAALARSDRAIPWIRGVAGSGSLVLGCAIFAGSF